MNKYKEIFFLTLIAVWVVITCWKGLFQPLYWDSAYSLSSHSRRIATSLNPNNYTSYNFQDDHLLPKSLINTESDYPHTFGTALFYAFSYIVFPKTYLIVWHSLSLILSLGFLVTLYVLIKKISSKFEGIFLVILMATNPLFLAQTTMVYHEIPGALFRYLSIYYLITNKNKLFLFSSIVAFFIRFENGPILLILAVSWNLFLKNWQFSFKDFKNKSLNICILLIFVLTWFIFHRYVNGWILISPLFGHPFNPKQALNDTLSFLFVDQGRQLISLITLIMLVLNFKQFLKKRKYIVLFLISTLFFFLTPLYIGTYLNRYSLSVLPIYYFFLVTSISFDKKSKFLKMFSLVVIFLLINHQLQFLYKCSSNFEMCLNAIEWIDQKKEIASYLENNIEKEAVVYANWDEVTEYSDPERFSGSFCQKCVNTIDYPNEFKFKKQNINQYILISPNTNHLIKEYAAENNLELIKIFGKNEFETTLFKIDL